MVAVFTGLGAGFERGSGAALGSQGLLGSSALGRAAEGVFFNAATGNLVLTRQDEFLVGRGPDVAIARTYNSQGNIAHDDNGDLWRQSSDRRVFGLTGSINSAGSTIKRLSGDGSEITYAWNGSYYATTDGAGAHDKLSFSAGIWTWTDGSTQIKETYEAATAADTWRIKTQIDLDLNTLTFAYESGTDRLLSVTTADGGAIKYAYDVNGNINAEEVWSGASQTLTRTHYTYESYVLSSQTKYRLKTVTVDLSPNDNSLGADAYTTTYTYDAANRIASVLQTDGSKLDITYDASGRVLTLSQTVGVDANSNPVAARVTSINYTDEGNGLTRTEITDPRGQVTKLWSKNADDTGTASTDERGQLVRLQAPPAITGGTPQEVNYTYDGSGNVTSAVTKSGATTLATTTYQYDARGNVTRITDANGNKTYRVYDIGADYAAYVDNNADLLSYYNATVAPTGRSKADWGEEHWTFFGSAEGRSLPVNAQGGSNVLLRETKVGGAAGVAWWQAPLHTRYIYDSENHLRYVIGPEGRVTEHRYKGSGEREWTIGYPEHAYPLGSTLLSEATMDAWRNGLADRSSTRMHQYIYDARGNVAQVVDYGAASAAGANLTTEGYRQEFFSYSQTGELIGRGLAPNGFTESFIYDGMGRLIASTDLAGGTTTIAFNDASTTTTVTTASGYTTVSTYNKAGELVTSVDFGTNTNGGTWNYLYDKNGQVRVAIKPSQFGPALLRYDKSYFLYDKAGRKIADIGHDGQIIEYKYDALNRLVATARYNTLLTGPQLATIGDPNSEVEIASIRPAAHANDVWQWNVYDAGGRIVETILGDGSVTTYAYDQSDRLIATTGYSNKLSAAQISALIATPPSAVITPTADAKDRISRSFYDRDGRLIGALNAEGALTRLVYDNAGQKIQETTYINLTAEAHRASGTFDQLLASITLDANKDVTNRYVYDGQGLLRYTIDALGRVTEFAYWENTTSYASGLVRKTVTYAAPLGAVANYSYATIKIAVALLAVSANDRTGYNVYNDRGQLSYAVDAMGAVTGFVYDTTGRITKTTQFAATVTSATLGADNAWKTNLDTWAASNSAGARVTRNFYAAREGDLIYTVDGEGYVTKFDYEAQGRVFTQYRFANAITVSDATIITDLDAANKGTAATTSYRHDALGRQNDTWDANGTRHVTIYNANGLKLYETVAFWQGADERFDQFEYDQAGRLIRETRGAGTSDAAVTQYAYDGLGNVSSITDPLGRVTALVYDKVGRVVLRTEASGTPDARVTSYEYDALGRGVKTTNALGASAYAYFDRLSRITLQIDAGGYATETSYNPFGEVASVTARALVTTGATNSTPPSITSNSADQTTTFGYDKNGRLTSRANALGATVTYQLDAFGNVVKSIDARNNASFFYYDKLGQLKLAVDAEGYATETSYDAEGRAKVVMRRAQKPTNTGNVNVWPTIVTDANDAQTLMGYDPLGRMVSTTDATGAVTAYEYDRRGNQTKVTNALGGVTERKFDDLDRMIEETVWFGDYNVAGQAKSTSKFTYDAASNLTKKIEAFGQPEQRTTDYTYDAMNRVKTITRDVIAAANSATGANVTPIEYFYYDAVGNLTEKRDGFGARTAYWYDAQGRVEYELAASETVSGNQKGTFTRNIYDANDNIIEKRVFADLVTLPAGVNGTRPSEPAAYRRTLYAYDKLNRLVSVSTPNVGRAVYAGGTLSVTTSTTLVTSYEYDANGNVIRTTDPKGAQTYSYYDKLGRKITQYDALNFRTDWTYDANGAASSEKRYANAGTSAGSSIPVTPGVLPANLPALDGVNDRTTTFTNDKMGRRLTETRIGVLVHNGSGGHTAVGSQIVYTYNALGQVATKLEATQDKIAYTFDRGGRILSEKRTLNGQTYLYTDAFSANVAPTVEYAYNALGDLTQSKAVGNANAADRITSFNYGVGGRLLSKSDASGFARTYVYDASERLVREQYSRATPTGSVEEAVGYDYDLAGRVIADGAMVRVGGVYTRSVVTGLGESVDTNVTRYNAYGEVSERGINGLFQTKFEYDNAGRVLRTNAGDGAWKYFMYDEAGAQTLTIATVGADLDTKTLDQVLALWTGGTSTIATTNVSGVIATITRYDARGQAVEVIEPQRQRNATTYDNLSTTRAYTAFGDVAYEINANGARIDYTYNTMGRRIKTESPAVEARAENGNWITGYNTTTGALLATSGTATTFRPVEHFYYDAAGRLVAQRDANTNLTRHTLLAGTGYNGTQALIAETIAADGGVVRTKYDVHGDARRIEDQLYLSSAPTLHVTTQSFDAMGRLISMNRSNILTDYYAYDGLGQRIKHWNSFYNANGAPTNNVEQTSYDHQGRITQIIAPGGDTTSYAHGWSSALATAGMGTFGGWSRVATYANGKTLTEKTDAFGHEIGKTDMGGRITAFTYDKAGRLTQRSATLNAVAFGETLYQSYYNTGRLKEIWQTTGSYVPLKFNNTYISTENWINYRGSKFGYDKIGQVTSQDLREAGASYWEQQGYYNAEGEWEPGATGATPYDIIISNQTTTFDALGRLVSWSESGGTAGGASGQQIGAATHNFTYDANGNIRRSLATYRALDGQGQVAPTATTQDYWYRYDAGNRMATAKGIFSGAVGTGSIQRGTTGVDTFYFLDGTRAYTLTGSWREDYVYDALARVTSVKGGSNLSAPGATIGAFTYDALGRQLSQYDYQGAVVIYSRTATYNAKNQLLSDDVSVHQSDDIYRTLSTYSYGTGANYALGAVTQIDAQKWKDGNSWPTTRTINTYDWFDSAVGAGITHDADVNNSTNALWTTTYTNLVLGGQNYLERAVIADGRPRAVVWSTDMLGQVIRRDEKDGYPSSDPHEIWHRFSGRQMGYVGNNGSFDVAYATSENLRQTPSGPTGSFADFDLAYDHINSYEQGSRGGVYTVQSGDTLQSIASQLWGDASLWWKIAEVNGLSAESTLTEGALLIIPVGVQSNNNNATTFRPYDPLEVLGNVSPTSPKPPRLRRGASLGQVILIIIAIVVTVIVANYASEHMFENLGFWGGVLSGATGAAAGSIASQGVGVATGIQEKFSWNAVALAAIGGAVSGGVGAAGETFANASALANPAVQGVTSSIITQGIGVATGLQDEFSWAGVAAAGVAGFVGDKVAPASRLNDIAREIGRSSRQYLSLVNQRTAAASLASAATRSLIDGSDFGDNMLNAVAEVVGQTIGESIAGGVSGRGSGTTGSAKVGSTPKNAAEVCQELGVDLSQGLTREDVLNYFGVDPNYEGQLEFFAVRKGDEMPVVQAEDIIVTAPRRSRPDNPLAGYVPYELRPASERTYASAGPGPSYLGNVGYNMRVGWDNALANFQRELSTPTSIDDVFRRAADPMGTRYIGATLNLAFDPVARGVGALATPLLPDSDAEWQSLENNRAHPSIFDPDRVWTGQDRRNVFGYGVVTAATMRAPIGGARITAAERGAVEFINPAELRWTQTTAGGSGRAAVWRERLDPAGTYHAYPLEPIDVVRTVDGLTTVDHTRAAVALEYGITSFPARVHLPADALPASMAGRFGAATTWGDAAAYRAARQSPPLPPTGTTTPPALPRRR